MIEVGDLTRTAQVRVLASEHRTWRTLWLIRRPVWRLVMVGFIKGYHHDGYSGVIVELEDATTRLRKTTVL